MMSVDLDQMLQRASEVKLSGGLVGRVCTVLLVGSVAIGAVGVAASNVWVSAGAIVAILIFALPILWRVINFAQKNPSAAILDGAQFIQHEQLILASKTNPEIRVTPGTQVEARPRLPLSPESLADLDRPDAPSLPPSENP